MDEPQIITAKTIIADTVRARRVEILDDHKQIRALVAVIDNEPNVILCNRFGHRALELRVGQANGAVITFLQNGNTASMGLALRQNGNALISMCDAEGKERFQVEVDPHGGVKHHIPNNCACGAARVKGIDALSQ